MTIISDNWRFTRSQKQKASDCGVDTEIEIYRSFLVEQLSQDVAEMLLVVQKEIDDDGTWLKPDDTKK